MWKSVRVVWYSSLVLGIAAIALGMFSRVFDVPEFSHLLTVAGFALLGVALAVVLFSSLLTLVMKGKWDDKDRRQAEAVLEERWTAVAEASHPEHEDPEQDPRECLTCRAIIRQALNADLKAVKKRQPSEFHYQAEYLLETLRRS